RDRGKGRDPFEGLAQAEDRVADLRVLAAPLDPLGIRVGNLPRVLEVLEEPLPVVDPLRPVEVETVIEDVRLEAIERGNERLDEVPQPLQVRLLLLGIVLPV